VVRELYAKFGLHETQPTSVDHVDLHDDEELASCEDDESISF
jgi:hypothetical protein